jgi:hypothetical protein
MAAVDRRPVTGIETTELDPLTTRRCRVRLFRAQPR